MATGRVINYGTCDEQSTVRMSLPLPVMLLQQTSQRDRGKKERKGNKKLTECLTGMTAEVELY